MNPRPQHGIAQGLLGLGLLALALIATPALAQDPFSDLLRTPTSAEPAKDEPAKEEPTKEEPAKADPAKAEPAKEEPARDEPARAATARTEPPAKDEPAKAEATPKAQHRPHSTIQILPDDIVWPKQPPGKKGIKNFFDRQKAGFDKTTLARVPDDLLKLFKPLLNRWRYNPRAALARDMAPLLTLLSLIALFIWLQRRLRNLADPLKNRIEPRLPTLLRPLAGSSARLALLTLPILALLALARIGASFFLPDQQTAATVLLNALWLSLAYRLALGVIREAMEGHWLNLDPDRVKRLKFTLIWIARLALIFQIILMAVEAFIPDPDVLTLFWFCFQIFLLIASGSLVWLKNEVFATLPEADQDVMWGQVRGKMERHYRTVLGITFALQVLWLFGYNNAASFLLTRGYALIGLLAILTSIQTRASSRLSHKIAAATSDEEEEVLVRMGRGIRFALGLTFIASLFALLGIWPYAEALLKLRLLRLGDVDISLYSLALAALIIGLFVLASHLARSFLMERVYPRIGLEIGVGYAINTVAHYLLVTIGLLSAVSSLGVDLSALTLFATALSVGVGFGLQDVTRNLASGFILLFGRSVKKGDYVQIDNHFGRVEELGARSVQIVTPDNTELVIPSSRLVSESIVNYTYTNPRIRVHIPVGVHYKSDMRLVEQALLHAAFRHHNVLHNPKPAVRLMNFGDSSVNLELLIWIDVRRIDPARLRGELYFHIWDVFKEQRIEIPYPQRDLHIQAGEMIQDLVRALRQQPQPEKTPPPPPPRLEPIASYLTHLDQAPGRVEVESLPEYPLTLESLMAQREQELNRAIIDFGAQHAARLTALASKINSEIKMMDIQEARHWSLDLALTSSPDRWEDPK